MNTALPFNASTIHLTFQYFYSCTGIINIPGLQLGNKSMTSTTH